MCTQLVNGLFYPTMSNINDRLRFLILFHLGRCNKKLYNCIACFSFTSETGYCVESPTINIDLVGTTMFEHVDIQSFL